SCDSNTQVSTGDTLFPKAKPSPECVGVFACAAVQRQVLKLFHVAATKNHLFWTKPIYQDLDHIGDQTPPFLFAIFLQSANADVVLIASFLVRKVSQFHCMDGAIDDQGRTQTGA